MDIKKCVRVCVHFIVWHKCNRIIIIICVCICVCVLCVYTSRSVIAKETININHFTCVCVYVCDSMRVSVLSVCVCVCRRVTHISSPTSVASRPHISLCIAHRTRDEHSRAQFAVFILMHFIWSMWIMIMYKILRYVIPDGEIMSICTTCTTDRVYYLVNLTPESVSVCMCVCVHKYRLHIVRVFERERKRGGAR